MYRLAHIHLLSSFLKEVAPLQRQMSEHEKYHSNISNVLIEQVIHYKRKEEKAKQCVNFWGAFVLVVLAIFLLISWYFNRSLDLTLSNILYSIRNVFSLAAIVCIVFGIGKLMFAKKDYEKAEDEFEQLREEIIDRQEQLWDTAERWENRSELFTEIDKQYGINLFHK